MKSRNLLKDIPSGKFHSVIFTTFSLNLYYLEQQVLQLLGSKGIHYVSILADSRMLSNQLENYGYLSQQRKRNYSIHGIQSSGAFHSKLIFLAGVDSILLIIGSGNLTASGHGKNLEVWNQVYVNSLSDSKLGLVIQAWNYLKQLHADLGDSANSKLKSIEDNCVLLSQGIDLETKFFDLDTNTQISFHVNKPEASLFSQLSDIIANEEIKRITIMCPFHDSEGNFIQELNKYYRPAKIDVIVQADFGALPFKIREQSNVTFFDWREAMHEKHKQSYFHAKNIILEGKSKSYLISGSANASIAAFGTISMPAINQESCVIYQSNNSNYIDLLSIKTLKKPVDLKDYKPVIDNNSLEVYRINRGVFIKSVEKNFDDVNVIFQINSSFECGSLQFYDTNGLLQFEVKISLETGEHIQQFKIHNNTFLLYAQVSINGNQFSNKQFITDINSFESTNPSPRNRSLNQIRKLIESGSFSTLKIIDYLNTIHGQKEVKNEISNSYSQKDINENLVKDYRDDLVYMSYAEIQEKAKMIDYHTKPNQYLEYKGVRLWESIFSYLKESREKDLEQKIDEEETEDISTSDGRIERNEDKQKRSISKSIFERSKDKVTKFFDEYHEILWKKTIDTNAEQPSLIDLSVYLIMIQILFHLLVHKETIETDKKEEKMEEHLLPLLFNLDTHSCSEYLIQFIGMFSMWCTQSKGFKNIDSAEYSLKIKNYTNSAFKTNICALSICAIVNKGNDSTSLSQWYQLNLLNTNLIFNSENSFYKGPEEFISFFPKSLTDEFGSEKIEEEIVFFLSQLNSLKIKDVNHASGDIYYHPEIGYAYIDKVINNPNNLFYKLFSPAFLWDEVVKNYWNGSVYSVYEERWLKSRKD